MRFWIVSELYYPDESATGYLLTKIAEGLSQFYPISVISCRNTQCADHTGHQVKEQRNGVTIWRSWVSHLDKNNLFFRLINATTSTIALFVRTLRLINAGDIVLVVTNPPFLPFVTKIACTLRGAKIMLLIHDVYPNVLVASGILKPLSIVSRLFDRLTRNLYKSVNAIIVLGRDMQHLVSEKIPSRNDHITIIRNWAETDTVYPLPKNENPYLKQLNLQDKFVLQYAGNMGRTHGLENILKCAISLREEENVHFLFIGSGAKRKSIEQICHLHHLQNVTIFKTLPRSEQVTFLNACDVAIISFVKNMAGVSVPSRMYNVMAAGKPIIAVADEDSELAMVINEELIGWVVPPGDIERLREIIIFVKSHPELIIDSGHRARLVAENKYTYDRVIEQYHKLISSISS